MTRPEVYLPRAWSASALNCYSQCSARFFYERALKLEPETLSAATLLGSATHCAMAYTRRRIMDGDPPSLDDVRAVFAETWLALTFGEEERIRINGKKTLGELCDQGLTLVEVLVERIDPAEKILAVEHDFELSITLSDGTTRKVVGVLDAVVVEPDDEVCVVDVKTRSRSLAGEDTDQDLQATLYTAAGRAFGASRFRLDAVVKRSKVRPTFEQIYVDRDETSLDVVARLIETAERGLLAGVYLPSPGPLCRFCSYQRRCKQDWGQAPRRGARLPLAEAA